MGPKAYIVTLPKCGGTGFVRERAGRDEANLFLVSHHSEKSTSHTLLRLPKKGAQHIRLSCPSKLRRLKRYAPECCYARPV
jgi:hypothetical protein